MSPYFGLVDNFVSQIAKSAGDFDTNAHPCRIGGADFLLYETTQQGGCKPIQDSELLEAFEPYIAAFLGK
jgi:hypothetical protein